MENEGRGWTGVVQTLVKHRPLWVTAASLAAGIAVLIVVGVALGPMLHFPREVVVQAIASTGLVLVAVLPIMLSTRRKADDAAKDAAVVREEVKNNHTSNFREDTDRHKDEILAAVEKVAQEVGEVKEDVRGVKSDIRGLRRDGGRRDDRLHRLESALIATARGETEDEALGEVAHTVDKRREQDSE